MFLCTSYGPDTRRDGLHAWQQSGNPVFFYFGRVHIHILRCYGTVYCHGGITYTEHHTAGLELIDANGQLVPGPFNDSGVREFNFLAS